MYTHVQLKKTQGKKEIKQFGGKYIEYLIYYIIIAYYNDNGTLIFGNFSLSSILYNVLNNCQKN